LEEQKEVLRVELMDAKFSDSLLDRVCTGKRTISIRIRVAIFTIENTEILDTLRRILIFSLAVFITAEEYKVRFKYDFT